MKSKTAPIIVAVMIPLVSVAAALMLIYLKKKNIASAASDEFPYAQYIASPESLAGNAYTANVELEMQLARIAGSGRVVAVRDEKRNKFAVLIPDSLNVNAQTKQRYEMDMSIGEGGKITVKSMKKY